MKIAIITTCYNRKELTMRCLVQLHQQINAMQNSEVEIGFYICDDLSTDGTREAIHAEFPDVHVTVSKGNLYWARGIYAAMQLAKQDQPDLYLMINDDVSFYADFLETLLRNYRYHVAQCEAFGLAGNTIETHDRELNYGGRGTDGKLIPCNGMDIECTIANWNCFAITDEVVDQIGLIDHYYEHGLADFDYCFMMGRANIPLYLMDCVVGECDSHEGAIFNDQSLGRLKRIKIMMSPTQMPVRSYFHYYIKNYGWKGLPRYIYGYLSNIGYIILNKDIHNNNR